jgi:hypothetical protein
MNNIATIYFAINIFIAGYNYSEDEKWETRTRAVFGLIIMLFFGSIVALFYYLSLVFSPILNWIINEIGFQYKLRFSKHWENILFEDENQSSREKLEIIKNWSEVSKGQFKRHSKMVYEKYK